MKITTTMYDYLHSELHNNGENEFFNQNQLTGFNDDFAFIQRIMDYDEVVASIVNRRIFHGLSLAKPEYDQSFKRMFVNRFLNRQIQTQTIDAFSAKVSYEFLQLTPYLNNLFENFDKYVTGQTDSHQVGAQDNQMDSRSAYQSLPQTVVHLDLNETIIDYADDNNVARTKMQNDTTTDSTNNVYSPDNLEKMQDVFDKVFRIFERKCFLHVW